MLRKAGHREFSDRHGGFAVEDGDDGGPFAVACADDAGVSAGELPQYAAALRMAGYRVEPAPDDDQVLRGCSQGTAETGNRMRVCSRARC